MAEKITSKFAGFGRHSTAAKYDYEKWFDGEVWKLTRGEDFQTNPLALRTTLYNAAKKFGVKVRTSIPDENTVIVQASPREDKPVTA